MKFLPAFTAESQESKNSLQDSGDPPRVENLKNEENINKTIIRMFSILNGGWGPLNTQKGGKW